MCLRKYDASFSQEPNRKLTFKWSLRDLSTIRNDLSLPKRPQNMYSNSGNKIGMISMYTIDSIASLDSTEPHQRAKTKCTNRIYSEENMKPSMETITVIVALWLNSIVRATTINIVVIVAWVKGKMPAFSWRRGKSMETHNKFCTCHQSRYKLTVKKITRIGAMRLQWTVLQRCECVELHTPARSRSEPA